MFNEYVDWTFCLFPPSFRGKVFSLWASLIVTAVADLPALQERQVDPWFGKIPWRRKWQPPLVFLPGESHGQRSLGGCSPGVAKIGHTECLPRPHFLVLLPGRCHGQSSLVGCSPGACKELLWLSYQTAAAVKFSSLKCMLPVGFCRCCLSSWRSSILFLFLWKILFPTNGWRVLSNTIFFLPQLSWITWFFSLAF